MKVEDYELLVKLNEVGTVRGAAAQLLISQPAISQRLKFIEQNWGEKLFIRTPKRLLITPAGEKVVSYAEETMKREREVRNEVASLSGEVGGTLSLGVSSVFGQYLLPWILEKYIEDFPKVQLHLTTGLSQEIRRHLPDYHITIFRGERVKNLKCEHLFSDRLFLIGTNKLEKEKPGPLIAFQGDEVLQATVEKWLLDYGKHTFSQIIKVDQIETCKQLMLRGIGQAILPESAIKDLKDGYDVTPLKVNEKALARETWVAYSEESEKLPQTKAFLVTLKGFLV